MHEILCSPTYIYWEVLYDMTCLKSDQKYLIYIAINCGKRQVTKFWIICVKSSTKYLDDWTFYATGNLMFENNACNFGNQNILSIRNSIHIDCTEIDNKQK